MDQPSADGSVAHRGEPDVRDEPGSDLYRPPAAPTEELNGMHLLGQGIMGAPVWRRQVGRLLLALFALGLLAPVILMVSSAFR